jgi:hypothetical protein
VKYLSNQPPQNPEEFNGNRKKEKKNTHTEKAVQIKDVTFMEFEGSLKC